MAMNQSRLERENLEAHVDLCAERYRVLEEKFTRLEDKVDDIAESMNKMVEKQASEKSANTKLILGAAATIIMGLVSTVVLLLLNLQGLNSGGM
jgi:hypothetical protein